MKPVVFILAMLLSASGSLLAQDVYDFNSTGGKDEWYIVDDGVMGGRSQGSVVVSEEGHGVFSGTVSLENNGGFSSVRYRPGTMSTSGHDAFGIRVKGDGKNYQFRVKSALNERHSYVYEFETNGKWQQIRIPFDEMYPTFRGMRLSIPNYPGEQMQEVTFLIANSRNESFHLEIDRIWIEED